MFRFLFFPIFYWFDLYNLKNASNTYEDKVMKENRFKETHLTNEVFLLLVLTDSIVHFDGASVIKFFILIVGPLGTFLLFIYHVILHLSGFKIARDIRKKRAKKAKEEIKRIFADLDAWLKKLEDEIGQEENTYYTNNSQETNSSNFNKDTEPKNNQIHPQNIRDILERFELPKDTVDFKLIKKQYRSLAKKYHPDLKKGNEKIMITIIRDYEILEEYFPKFSEEKVS